MAMDKLQLSLIGLGSLGLIGLFAYNKWQESRARRHAENVFGAEHRDVLLDEAGAEVVSVPAEAEMRIEPGERIEPMEAPPPSRWDDADAPSVGRATLNPTVLRSAMGETSGSAVTELVAEAVALGLPDPQLGQAIHLVARAVSGADRSELIPALTRALPNFMVPRHVHWREVMPVSPNGKLDRVALAAELAEETQA